MNTTLPAEQNESSCDFWHVEINLSTILAISLFILSEVLAFKKKYHSVTGMLRYYLTYIYITMFPESDLAREIEAVTITTATSSPPSIVVSELEKVVEIPPISRIEI